MLLKTNVILYFLSGVSDFFLILSCNSFWILKRLKLLPHQLRASSNTKCYCCNTALMFILELMIDYFSTDKKFQAENLITSSPN